MIKMNKHPHGSDENENRRLSKLNSSIDKICLKYSFRRTKVDDAVALCRSFSMNGGMFVIRIGSFTIAKIFLRELKREK